MLKNSMLLYVLTFSNHLLGLVTIPYLTRILGPVIYGKLGVALSVMLYVQLILDFGFILSATEFVSKHRDDKDKCRKIFSVVTYAKIILSLILGCFFFLICMNIYTWKENMELYMYLYLAYCINAFLPDYIYRGKEQMQLITIRTILVKVIFTSFIFIFIKKESDLYLYPIILALGNFIAVVMAYTHVYYKYEIRLCRVSLQETKDIIVRTYPFFISRISSTFYQAATMIILGTIYVNEPVLGYYSAADKLMSAIKSISSPIADSLYPYMTRNKDYELIKKLMKIISPVVLFGSIIVLIYAEPICMILFGTEYRNAQNVLRCMLPAMMVILPTYIICFPVLVPMGLEKYANCSNVLGAALQIVLIIMLIFTKKMNIYNVCICSIICEVFVFGFRCCVVYRYRDRMKKVSNN